MPTAPDDSTFRPCANQTDTQLLMLGMARILDLLDKSAPPGTHYWTGQIIEELAERGRGNRFGGLGAPGRAVQDKQSEEF